MTSDKSIDGLSTRAAKTRAKISTRPKKTKAKTVSPEDFVSAPTTNIWDAIKAEPETPTPTNISEQETDRKTMPKPSQKASKTVSRAQKTPTISDIKPIKTKKEDTTSFLKPVQAFDFSEEDGLIESEETVEDMLKTTRTKNDEDTFLEESQNSKKSHKPKKAKKKPSKKRKVITIISLIIVLLLIGVILWAVFWGNDIIAKITGGRGNVLDLLTFTTETYDPLKTDANGRTNILAFGTGGYDMNGEEGGGVHDGAQLTDSIMLISFDQKTGDIAMTSLPRDLKGPATCTATGKINEVYWCNGGGGDASTEQEEKAATALMNAVGSILGVDIQYFAHLNWGSLASIVDILGGITVVLDEDILDYQYTGAVYEAGKPYTINGAEAVGLARARHGTSGGDFSRGASQQKIIIGIKNKILEKNLSLSDILGLVTTLGDNLRTNFSVSELKTIAHMPEILDFDIMRQISLYPDYMTTGMINGISYVLPKAGANNYTTIQKFLDKMLSSDPRVYEEPTIAIYNASDTDGAAAAEKAKLEQEGYTVSIIDNAPEGVYEEGTTVYAISGNKNGTKKLLEEYYGTTTKPTEELPTTITPSYDFIIILNNNQN